MKIGHNGSTDIGRLLSPAEAASGLQLPPSTLRLYSVKFATLLSDHARPKHRTPGRPGRRRYTADDLAILARARDLVRSGRGFNEAIVEMGGTPPEEESAVDKRPDVTHPGADSPDAGADQRLAPKPNDQTIVVPTQAIAAATEGWRELATEKGKEIDRLLLQIDRLELELREMRRPWWQRIFSGS